MQQFLWVDEVFITRGHSGYGISQWETKLQSNVFCHWLSPYPKWFLITSLYNTLPSIWKWTNLIVSCKRKNLVNTLASGWWLTHPNENVLIHIKTQTHPEITLVTFYPLTNIQRELNASVSFAKIIMGLLSAASKWRAGFDVTYLRPVAPFTNMV